MRATGNRQVNAKTQPGTLDRPDDPADRIGVKYRKSHCWVCRPFGMGLYNPQGTEKELAVLDELASVGQCDMNGSAADPLTGLNTRPSAEKNR